MKAKHTSRIMLINLILSLLTFGQAQAKEIVKVTIVGPGLNGAIELTDEKSLSVFRQLGFADQNYQPLSAKTEHFFEIRMAIGDSTDIVATSIFHYYPASKKHPSYVYYAEGINSWSSRDGQYFLLPEDTDRALRDLLVSLGASLPGTVNQPARSFKLPFLWLIVGLCLCVTVGIAIRLKRPVANTNR